MYILYKKIFTKSSAAGAPQSTRKQAFARLIVRGPQKLRIKLNFKLTSYAPAFNLAICYLTLSYLDPNSIFRGYEPLSISYSFALIRSFTHNQSFAFHRLSAALGTARY